MSDINILQKIAAGTREDIARRKKRTPIGRLRAAALAADKPRDFAGALRGPSIRLIAEIKRASPSKGPLNLDIDAAGLARSYRRGGAAAISVVAEPLFFRGDIKEVAVARSASGLPVLCKNFIVEEYQVLEARAHSADAVLLIAALHEVAALRSLLAAAIGLGMSALVEVHSERQIEDALAAGATLIGINNRNLEDFSVDLSATFRLKALVPAHVPVVSESGIRTREDLSRLEEAGVSAVLVGEALITSPDPEAKVRELLGLSVYPPRALQSPLPTAGEDRILSPLEGVASKVPTWCHSEPERSIRRRIRLRGSGRILRPPSAEEPALSRAKGWPQDDISGKAPLEGES